MVITAIYNQERVLRPYCEERRQQLSASLPVHPVWVQGDRTRLEQAIGNLLNNASTYTDPGGRIWAGVEATDAEVRVRVQDSGIGIEPTVFPLIFNLFVQADRRLERSVGGLGIGLSLVKQLVGDPDRGDRLGPSRRPAQIAGSGFRPAPGQAGESRRLENGLS